MATAFTPGTQQIIDNTTADYVTGKLPWDEASAIINNAVQQDISSGSLKSNGDGTYTTPTGETLFKNETTGMWDTQDVGQTGSQGANSNTTVVQSDAPSGNTPTAPTTTSTTVSDEGTAPTPTESQNSPTVTESSTVVTTATDPNASGYGEENDLPESQATINPDEDPFEKARLDAEAGAGEGPTEQAVIDATDDPQLTKEDQAKLEQEQADNRAKLKAEEDAAAGNAQANTASSVDKARQQQTISVARNQIQKDDWRVRLSLAPSAKYLYNAATKDDILYPLKETDGVIFPYTPQVQTAYRANYDAADLMHSNYKMYFYKNSYVEEISVTAEFTAQDNTEALYMLAVIHFFKSVTKMFYGQDGKNGPKAGTPPPLCYLNGFGQYQFNEHPVLISSFTYNLPNDVDYIRAGMPTTVPGTPKVTRKSEPTNSKGGLMSWLRTTANNLRTKQSGKGSASSEAAWKNYANAGATYVPTKIQLQLTLLPIVTRNDISKNFSLEKYATGSLLKGRDRPSGGGIW